MNRNPGPGRRLDFQVAEEVLGWKRVTWEKGMTIFGRYKDIHLDRDFDVLGPPNWDGESSGTNHMIDEAHRRGLEVFVYKPYLEEG